jgi:hypothetical protein
MTDLFATLIIAVFTGAGTAIGNYLATRYALKHVDALDAKVREHTEQLSRMVKP